MPSTDPPPAREPTIEVYENRRGNQDIIVDQFKFRFKRERKRDNALVWGCALCKCVVETTKQLNFIRITEHSHNTIDADPSTAPEAMPTEATESSSVVDTSQDPSVENREESFYFVKTKRGHDALVFNENIYHKKISYGNGATTWRCSFWSKTKCNATCKYIDL